MAPRSNVQRRKQFDGAPRGADPVEMTAQADLGDWSDLEDWPDPDWTGPGDEDTGAGADHWCHDDPVHETGGGADRMYHDDPVNEPDGADRADVDVDVEVGAQDRRHDGRGGLPHGPGATDGRAGGSGRPPGKFVFLAAATRYAIDFMPHHQAQDWDAEDPEEPEGADDRSGNDPPEPDPPVEGQAGGADSWDDAVHQVAARPPRHRHSRRKRPARGAHASRATRRAGAPDSRVTRGAQAPGRRRSGRRLAMAGVLVVMGVAGAAAAVRRSGGGGEPAAASTVTTSHGTDTGARTAPSTFVVVGTLPEQPDEALTATTVPVPAPATTAPTFRAPSTLPQPDTTTTMPATTTTTTTTQLVATTTSPPTPTTTVPQTTTTTHTTTTTAQATTTTAQATTTTTSAPPTTVAPPGP